MRARMKDNLIVRYQLCPEFKANGFFKPNDLVAERLLFGWSTYFKTKEFLKSIEGKVVDLVFVNGDAFEKNDNNYWLPESLWEPL